MTCGALGLYDDGNDYPVASNHWLLGFEIRRDPHDGEAS